MESRNENPFYLKETEYSYLYKVIFNGRFIGHIDERNEGTFIMQTDKIFDKFKGFGLPKELLEHSHLRFNNVKVIYKGVNYISSKKTFLEMGKSQIYPDGEKLYLNIRYFNQPNHNQQQFDLFSEGGLDGRE